MQSAYFFQPDYYYGYHNGTMPGRVDDRLEADTKEYLAVVRRSSMIPMYFYDYTTPWDGELFENIQRNEFGLVDPDEHKPSECVPKQVYTEDMTIQSHWQDDDLIITVKSESAKGRMVTGVFDIPYESDFVVSFDKSDVSCKKIVDGFTGNTHLFVDLGAIQAGKTIITVKFTGKPRAIHAAEIISGGLGVMYFGAHAYIRSTDKEAAYRVSMPAPDGAYLRLISGKKVYAEKGKLEFSVNACWEDESAVLYGYPQTLLEQNADRIHTEYLGQTTCSRWSGQ